MADVLFYSKTCQHCEALFRSGLVNPAVVRLVCVDTTSVRLPPEVNRVPTLWDARARRLLVGAQIADHMGAGRAPGPQGAAQGPQGAQGAQGGGGGGGGMFAGFDMGGVGASLLGGADDLGGGDGPVFSSLQDAYGGGAQGGPRAQGQPGDRAAAAALTRGDTGGSLDVDKFQAQRDAELRSILAGQIKQ